MANRSRLSSAMRGQREIDGETDRSSLLESVQEICTPSEQTREWCLWWLHDTEIKLARESSLRARDQTTIRTQQDFR